MFCTNCGNQMPDGSQFCTRCGAPVQQNSKKEWLTGKPPEKSVDLPKKQPSKEYWQGQPPKKTDVRSNSVTSGNQNRFADSVTQAGVPGAVFGGNSNPGDRTMYVLPDNSVPDASQTVYNYNQYADSNRAVFPQDTDFPQGIPDEPPKKKKNLALKIVAVALVIFILAGVSAVGIISAINKSELDAEGVTYIEIDEFPVLKNESELVVYNEKDFPATVYGIKVERFSIGGILRNLNITEEVFIDESSAASYYLNLDDGEYRITLTDISSVRVQSGNAQKNEDATVVIIIDVKVDGDAPDAAERVDVTSKEVNPQKDSNNDVTAPVSGNVTPSDDYSASEAPTEAPTQTPPATQSVKPDIEATNSDFETLADILLAMNFTEYDSKSATTAYAIDYMLTGEVASWGYDYFYKDILRNPTVTDPQNRFGTDYRVMSSSNVEWICENVLNITYDPAYSSSKSYVQNGKVYRKTLPVSENVNYFATLTSYKVVGKKYEVTGEYYATPVGTTSAENGATLIGKFIITAELKNINGREMWTIYSIKSVN